MPLHRDLRGRNMQHGGVRRVIEVRETGQKREG